MPTSTPLPPPLTISFSGIDGAGKSTQIALLQAVLTEAGLRFSNVTFWDDVVALKNLREGAGHKVFKGDQGVGSPERPLQRRDKNVRSPLLNLFRMGFYLLDLLSLRRTVRRVQRLPAAERPAVVIFDRYLYDEVANIPTSNLFYRLYRAALLRLTPHPRLALILDADPDAAFARKPEYPLDFLQSNRQAYLELASVAGIVVLPPGPVAQAHQRILLHLRQAGLKQNAPFLVQGTGRVSDGSQSVV